jgi:hypothetical protein
MPPSFQTYALRTIFIVAPAPPSLAELPGNPIYRESVGKSDFGVTDSSLMVIVWKLFTGRSLNRISEA